MLFKSPALTFFSILLLLIGLSIDSYCQPEELNDPEDESPFTSGKIKEPDGGGKHICQKDFFLIPVTFANLIENNQYVDPPCDLHIGITNSLGETIYERIHFREFWFSHYIESSNEVSSSGELRATPIYKNYYKFNTSFLKDAPYECDEYAFEAAYTLDLYCLSASESRINYIPVDYCNEEFDFSSILGIFMSSGECSVRFNDVAIICCGQESNEGALSMNTPLDIKILPQLEGSLIVSDDKPFDNSNIIISNLAGEVMQIEGTQLMANGNLMLYHSKLESGFYFISVQTENNLTTKKFVIF